MRITVSLWGHFPQHQIGVQTQLAKVDSNTFQHYGLVRTSGNVLDMLHAHHPHAHSCCYYGREEERARNSIKSSNSQGLKCQEKHLHLDWLLTPTHIGPLTIFINTRNCEQKQ